MIKRDFILLTAIILLILFFPRAESQNAQVSPVANLTGSNSTVINNNMQMLQNGMNGILYSISQYFPGGIVQTYNGGTGVNLSVVATGDTLVMGNYGTSIVGISPSASGDVLTSQGLYTSPLFQAPAPLPHILIGTWTDNTGTSSVNGTINQVIIDSGTDWASKNITIIVNAESNNSDTFNSVFPSITNTSATALSGMQHATNINGDNINFVIKTMTLGSNTYTVLTGNSSQSACAIGTNSSGNLVLVSINGNNGAPIYSQITGTILRTP